MLNIIIIERFLLPPYFERQPVGGWKKKGGPTLFSNYFNSLIGISGTTYYIHICRVIVVTYRVILYDFLPCDLYHIRNVDRFHAFCLSLGDLTLLPKIKRTHFTPPLVAEIQTTNRLF